MITGKVIPYLQQIAALVSPVETTMFVTSTHWGQIARELVEDHFDDLTCTNNLPTKRNFERLRIQTLTVANAGTEDQGVVNELNQPGALKANFAWKRDNLISGKTS